MKKSIVVGIIVLALGITGCGALKPEPQEVDLEDYLSYEFSGYDGEGIAEFVLDYDGMIDDSENLERCNPAKLRDAISVSLSQADGLSNGDEIRVEWDVDAEDLEEEYNVDFKFDTVEITVEGLEIRPEFDPFEYMEVSYSGIAPSGYISISSASTPIGTINYSASATSGLRNGDTVTITAYSSSYIDLVDLALEYDYQLTSDTMEYTVSGLDEYIDSIDDINDEALSMLQEQAVNAFYASTNWTDEETVNSVTYDGMYLMCKRDTSTSWGAENICYIVLKVNASNPNVESFEYYYYVSYENLVLLNDGTVTVNTSYYDVPYGSSFFGNISGTAFNIEGGGDYYYVGYQELNNLYMNEIQNNLVDYEYETTYAE
jgi:hypothetical protein